MRPGHWIAVDYAVGALAALFGLLVTVHSVPAALVTLPSRLVLGAVIFFPVALRRRRPVPAFCALIVLAVLATATGPAGSSIVFLAASYVLYTVTVTGNRQTGVAALAFALVVIAALVLLDRIHQIPAARGNSVDVVVAFALIISWMTGYSVRQRRLYAQMLQHEAASSAVNEERLRIARELHDVVAHSMSVIAVQAGYGQYVIDDNPADAREALGAIQATSRDALEEMRRMLGVLRQQDASPGPVRAGPTAAAGPPPAAVPAGPPPAGMPGPRTAAGARPAAPSAPLAPAPGLADLDRLIQRTRGAGVRVSLERSGRVRAVPAGVDLSAYRIIQEALTNVVRHAGSGARCAVSVGYGDEALDIRVTDDGGQSLVLTPAAVTGTGHGIIGMRERANLCGGEFSAGPLPDGGFRVTATLPLLSTAAGDPA
jgi:signal transduction histidine kinase